MHSVTVWVRACTGQMLAALLGWPQATYASKVDMQPGGKTLHVTREVSVAFLSAF